MGRLFFLVRGTFPKGLFGCPKIRMESFFDVNKTLVLLADVLMHTNPKGTFSECSLSAININTKIHPLRKGVQQPQHNH